MAARMPRKLGLKHYKCDDHFSRHLNEAEAADLEFASKAKSVTHEYIFMRSDEENVDFALGVHSEEFDFVIQDILQETKPVIAEGCCLLPQKLAALNIPKSNVFYLVPTESFHRREYRENRPWAWDRLEETSDPEQAYEKDTDFDALFGEIGLKAAELIANQSLVVTLPADAGGAPQL